MTDIWMDVDTAVKVPCNKHPMVNKNGTSLVTTMTHESPSLAVYWNFTKTDGTITATKVTPTTGGNYDWAQNAPAAAIYNIELPASGGASANNDTEGFGWISGNAASVLPFSGPIVGFRNSRLNNKFIDDSASLNDFSIANFVASIADGSFDFREMTRIIFSVAAGKSTGGGTTSLKFRDSADAKDRVTATVDENGNRTGILLDGS